MRHPYHAPEGLTNLLFTTEGRISRKTWWLCTIVNISLFVMSLLFAIFMNAEMLFFAYMFPIRLILFFCVYIKRLHDINLRGWWMLLEFIGCGLVILIICGFIKGTDGPNRFGPKPLSTKGETQ